MAVEPASPIGTLDELDRVLASKGMEGYWRGVTPLPTIDQVRPPYAPACWRWADVRSLMERAAELIQPGPDAERRSINLHNPSLRPLIGRTFATHTVSASLQMVLPGEVAPSHRHTPAAIRFVLEGSGALTFVDGDPCEMHPGDLILTPGWSWHGHTNPTDRPMVWMDSLDVPLVFGLRSGVYEDYPGEFQEITKPPDTSISRYGGGQMRPVWERWTSSISPLLSYSWAQTERALRGMAAAGEASPYDDVAFEYTNPATGGHALPTLGCWIQMLRSGIHMFRGRGTTVIDGVQLDWQQGDFFALPPWAWHEHRNRSASEEAILFSTNDIPLREAINLAIEVPYAEHDGHQPVVTSYEERYPDLAL
jgi:gentisate 1,2-dioxygenase